MVVLLLLLGLIAIVAGMFGLGLGVPVKDTAFGGALLVSSSVAITGGLILVGLAAAVCELRRVLQAGIRQMRPPERFEAERGHGAGRMEPRLGAAGLSNGGAPGGTSAVDPSDVIPGRTAERPHKPVREERLPPDAAPEPRLEPQKFDAIRPADYRKPDMPADGPKLRADSPPSTGDVKSPPLSPGDAVGAIKPVRVLKSGKINDVGYTLFSDGSIETQTPGGILRFGSIDEFRRHLEKTN